MKLNVSEGFYEVHLLNNIWDSAIPMGVYSSKPLAIFECKEYMKKVNAENPTFKEDTFHYQTKKLRWSLSIKPLVIDKHM